MKWVGKDIEYCIKNRFYRSICEGIDNGYCILDIG